MRELPEISRRFADFPQDFARLPTVSFVIPDQNHDMHDGSFEDADKWPKTHIAPHVDWAMQHNSLLVGPMVKAGSSDQRINHYNALRTLLDFYDLPLIGASRNAEAIKNIWVKHE